VRIAPNKARHPDSSRTDPICRPRA
jgi:hypothetical protein